MKIFIEKNYELLSSKAVLRFKKILESKKVKNIAFPTGNTPKLFYRKLVELYKKGKIDFSKISGFLIDEYYPMKKDSKDSFNYYISNNFFALVNLKEKYSLNGSNLDFISECRSYKELIEKKGGLDMAILGIGENGHIGFNEPGSELNSRVRLVELKNTTLDLNRAKYEAGPIPRYALTMGIYEIFRAKRIMLLASGKSKSERVRDFLNGPISRDLPVSVLRLHPDIEVIIDKEAAVLIEDKIMNLIN